MDYFLWWSTYRVEDDLVMQNKLEELAQLGSLRLDEKDTQDRYTDVVEARKKFVELIGIKPETIKEVQNHRQTLIPLDTFILTQRTMYNFGLDAVKIVNSLPSTIGLAPESIKDKIDNLTILGLDAVKIVNSHPATLGYAPESVKAKVLLLNRLGHTLRWRGSVQSLIEYYPSILGFNKKKLIVLAHIAAKKLNSQEQTMTTTQLQSALIVPLEKYIIALGEKPETDYTVSDLVKKSRQIKLSSKQRSIDAMKLAPSLGKIGASYLRYKRKKT